MVPDLQWFDLNSSDFVMCKSNMYSTQTMLQILNCDLFLGWLYVVL